MNEKVGIKDYVMVNGDENYKEVVNLVEDFIKVVVFDFNSKINVDY